MILLLIGLAGVPLFVRSAPDGGSDSQSSESSDRVLELFPVHERTTRDVPGPVVSDDDPAANLELNLGFSLSLTKPQDRRSNLRRAGHEDRAADRGWDLSLRLTLNEPDSHPNPGRPETDSGAFGSIVQIAESSDDSSTATSPVGTALARSDSLPEVTNLDISPSVSADHGLKRKSSFGWDLHTLANNAAHFNLDDHPGDIRHTAAASIPSNQGHSHSTECPEVVRRQKWQRLCAAIDNDGKKRSFEPFGAEMDEDAKGGLP